MSLKRLEAAKLRRRQRGARRAAGLVRSRRTLGKAKIAARAMRNAAYKAAHSAAEVTE